MKSSPSHIHIAKWFFILVSIVTFYFAWEIMKPFAIIMATTIIFSIVLTPLHKKLLRTFKYERLTAAIVMLLFTLGVIVPVGVLAGLVTDQALGLAKSVSETGIQIQLLDSYESLPFYDSYPESMKSQVQAFDAESAIISSLQKIANIGATAAVDGVLAIGQFVFSLLLFYLGLFYFLMHRKEVYTFMVSMSPFENKLDTKILSKLTSTVRRVMAGALIVAVAQGALAAIGMTIVGVPSALLWGAVTVVMAQIPMVGPGLVMGPAVIYLIATGNYAGAIFLTIWAIIAVGTIDNVLTPILISGKGSKMPELLILIFILGGLQLFGLIGLILGPTILAALTVIVEIYQAGYLEGKKVKRI